MIFSGSYSGPYNVELSGGIGDDILSVTGTLPKQTFSVMMATILYKEVPEPRHLVVALATTFCKGALEPIRF